MSSSFRSNRSDLSRSESGLFDPEIERAIQVALLAHAAQTRKGTQVPYASHPVHVAIKLVRLGCSSAVVQAGLLHDVVEDCDGWTIERLREEFSSPVADWVAELTDAQGEPWENRKQAAVDKVPNMSPEAATIKAADKLHNLSSLAHALEDADDRRSVWKHFSRGPQETLAMSERLVGALESRIPDKLAIELNAALERLRGLCE